MQFMVYKMRSFEAMLLVTKCVFVAKLLQNECYADSACDNKGNITYLSPLINQRNGTVELSFKASWHARCKSNNPIRWIRRGIHPQNGCNFIDLKSYEYATGDPDEAFGAFFTIPEASAYDVGRYYCVHKEYNFTENPQKHCLERPIARLYVYVNDTVQPIVPVPDNVFKIARYDHFTVPCKPSYRDVKMKLCNLMDEFCLTDYDPKKGFTVKANSFNVKILQFICMSNSSNQTLTARFEDDSKANIMTVINPQIDHKNQSVEIPFRADWRISCKSNRPIRWIWYDPWFERTSNDAKTIEYATDDPHKIYGAFLLITNASARDVGRYYCILKESANEGEISSKTWSQGSSASIYVFVRDNIQSTVPVPNEVFKAYEYNIIVPCKPSHPDVKVTLCNLVDKVCFTDYNPEKGFTLHADHFENNLVAFNCSSGLSSSLMTVQFRVLPDISTEITIMVFSITTLATILVLGNCILIWMCCSKKRHEVKASYAKKLVTMLNGDLNNYIPTMTLSEQAIRLPYKAEYEFPSKKIILQEQLGEGAFGVVMKGTAIGIVEEESETTVAVKMVKKKYDIEALQALVAELKMMIHLGQHLNVVNLLGAVTKNVAEQDLMVIVEYCPFGNLLEFLRNNRARFIDEFNQKSHSEIGIGCSSSQNRAMLKRPFMKSFVTLFERFINTNDLICWAFQIANGMDYLASRNVLHGDLAARNVLLSNDNVVKIGDFGMARSLYNGDKYEKTSSARLPVRWLALECLKDGLFSTYSDIWAYGIMLWELFSLGTLPYLGIEVNTNFCKMLLDGFRMECPPFSNQDIYDIMLSCWRVRPDSRPSFKELKSQFNAMLPNDLQDHYLALNEPYLPMNAVRMNQSDIEYLSCSGPPEAAAPPTPCSEARPEEFIEMTTFRKKLAPPARYVNLKK